MVTLSLLAVSAVAAAPSVGWAGGIPAWVRSYETDYSANTSVTAHLMIPAWARKYNMNCSGCHSPAVPRLNATGMQFKWAGYRMPDDFNDQISVDRLQNYLAVRGRFDYVYSKTTGSATTSQFQVEDATIFAGGSFGSHYSAFFEFEREAEDAIELTAHIGGKWGTPKSYGGFRGGPMHWFQREGLAGFDRPTGIRTAITQSAALTSGIPFRLTNDQLGVEAFYVSGNNRLSGELLSGINAAGVGDEPDPDTKKDFALIDQFLLDSAGSGITAIAYFGALDSVAGPAQTAHFTRFGLSANKFVNRLEVVGTVLIAKDNDLPTPTFPTSSIKGLGYWVGAGYTLPSSLTLYGRYEHLDPNTDVADNARARFVVGGVLPVNVPEYLRLTAEFAHDKPQLSGAPTTNALTLQLMLNF
jgi:hypothetical protein